MYSPGAAGVHARAYRTPVRFQPMRANTVGVALPAGVKASAVRTRRSGPSMRKTTRAF